MDHALRAAQAGEPVTQELANAAVIGVLGRNKKWLSQVVKHPALINARHICGMTPLYAACYAVWAPAVKQLLDAGADPQQGLEALHLARLDRVDALVVPVDEAQAAECIRYMLARKVRRVA